MTNISKRELGIDILRLIAIFMIVMAHILAPVYSRPDFIGGSAWFTSFLIITFSRLGVPLFFMISGYLLFKKERTLHQNLNHTFRRLIFPFLFWTGVTYFVFYLNNTLPKIDLNLFLSGGGTEYYFLIGLAIIYLLNPFIRKFVSTNSNKKIIFILLVLSLITVGQTYLTFIFHLPQFTILNYWFLGIFYFMYGGYVNKNKQITKKIKLNFLLFIMPFLINIIYIYLVRRTGFNGDLYLESYFGPTVLMSSLGLFNLVMHYDFQILKPKITNLVIKFSNLSFGVFLVHGIILDLLFHKTKINPYGNVALNLWLFLALSISIIFVGSYIVSFVIEKNKFGRILLGQSS